jgi:hypothetical protein
MVRAAKPVPDGLNERVVTLRRRSRVLEEAVVARLTTPTNLLRLVTETVIVMDVPWCTVRLALDTVTLKSLTDTSMVDECVSNPLVAFTVTV